MIVFKLQLNFVFISNTEYWGLKLADFINNLL